MSFLKVLGQTALAAVVLVAVMEAFDAYRIITIMNDRDG